MGLKGQIFKAPGSIRLNKSPTCLLSVILIEDNVILNTRTQGRRGKSCLICKNGLTCKNLRYILIYSDNIQTYKIKEHLYWEMDFAKLSGWSPAADSINLMSSVQVVGDLLNLVHCLKPVGSCQGFN